MQRFGKTSTHLRLRSVVAVRKVPLSFSTKRADKPLLQWSLENAVETLSTFLSCRRLPLESPAVSRLPSVSAYRSARFDVAR